MKHPYGWTVIRNPKIVFARSNQSPFIVYPRDCPADAAHFAADLAPFTHSSQAKAREAGKRGEYAYKQ